MSSSESGSLTTEQLFAQEALAAATRKQERVILLVLAAVQFMAIVDFVVVMPLGPELKRALKIGPAEFGLIVSAYTFAAGIAGLLATAVIDRYPRRTVFLSLYAGFLMGTLACGFAPNYPLLVAARAITGVFGGILGGLAMTIVGDVFPAERRGRATGVLMSAFAGASVLGIPLGTMIGQRLGWQMPFLVLVMLGLPVLVLGVLALPRLDGHLNRQQVHPWHALRATFSSVANWNAFALFAVLMMGGFAVIPYISPYLVQNVGVREEHLPLVYVVGGLLTLFVAPLVGKLADRYGKLLLFRIIAPLSAAMLIAITFLPPVPTAVAISVVGLLMVTNAGRMVAAMAMATGTVPAASRGGFMSANSSIQHVASGIGTFLASKIITESADGRLQHFGAVGLIACAITLLSVWLAGRLRPAEGAEASLLPVAEGA